MAAKIAQEVSNGKAVLRGAQARGMATTPRTVEHRKYRMMNSPSIDSQPAIVLRQRGPERWSIKSIARRVSAWTAIRRLAGRFRA